MAERRPLVVISGQMQELPGGDTLPVTGGVVAPVATRIRRSTSQSIPTGAGWTDLAWDTLGYQANGTFWASGATVTIPETAYYQVFVEASFDGTGLIAAATTNLQILLNGATVIGDDEKQLLINGKAAMWAMAQRLFTAGDAIKVQVKHSDAGSVNILTQGDHSPDIIVTKLTGAKGDPGGADTGLGIALRNNHFSY
jgi:archaellum component FlaF (FlaF/FlaG flagellin family)